MKFLLFALFFATAYGQMPDCFTTQRVHAERINNQHIDHIFELFSDLQVQKAYGILGADITLENIFLHTSFAKKHWDGYGCGRYVLFHKETNEFLGIAGFHRDIVNDAGEVHCAVYEDLQEIRGTDELEIYYFYMPKYWRQGYGYEVANKLIELAFTHLPYPSIIAYILPENNASHKLIKKMDFIEEGTVFHNNQEHILYRLKTQAEPFRKLL